MSEKIYIAGETTHTGIYTCTNCGKKILINRISSLPNCPVCNNFEYTE